MFESIETYKTELPERYQILEVLGQGGMGIVVKAFDTHLAKPVAIKLVTIDLAGMNLVRFHAEAKILAKLDHVNILTALDFSVTKSNKPYLVLDFLEGVDLENYIEMNGPLPFDRAISLIYEILSALDYAHRCSVIHRDIKPSNVILILNDSDELQAKVVDFGLSKLLQDDQDVTTTGSIIGSPLYMSPEQAKGVKVDERADVYSIGCLIYKMITGQAPLEDESVVAMFNKKLREIPEAMGEVNPDVDFPPELEAIVSKCLEIDPDNRYSSMAELKEALVQLEKELEVDYLAEQEQDRNQEKAAKLLEAESSVNTSADARLKLTMLIVLSIILGAAAIYTFNNFIDKRVTSKKEIGETHAEFDITRGEYSVESGNSQNTFKHFKLSRDKSGLASVEAKEGANDDNLKELVEVKNIGHMNLKNTEITGVGFKYVDCSKLKVLDLSESKVNYDGLKVISAIDSLEELDLGYNQGLTADGIKSISNIETIGYLKLPNTGIVDDAMADFYKFKKFRKLDLRFNESLSEKGIAHLETSGHLWFLSVGGHGVKDGVFKGISKLKQLKTLALDSFTADELARALELLEGASIIEIHFSNCPEFPDETIEKCMKLSRLKSFVFRENSNPSLAIINSLRQVKGLKFVDFQRKPFTDKDEIDALKELMKVKSLRKLAVSFQYAGILGRVKKGNPNLEVKPVY